MTAETEPTPRPSIYTDLPDSELHVEVGWLALDPSAPGMLPAVDDLIAALREHYGSRVNASMSNDRMSISRPATPAELDERLQRAQRRWDVHQEAALAAKKREHLTVGDQLDVDPPIVPCSRCSLHYQHHGKHITVHDGHVTNIEERR